MKTIYSYSQSLEFNLQVKPQVGEVSFEFFSSMNKMNKSTTTRLHVDIITLLDSLSLALETYFITTYII